MILAPPLLFAALIAAMSADALQGTVPPVEACAAGAARSPVSRIAAPPPKAAFMTDRVFIYYPSLAA